MDIICSSNLTVFLELRSRKPFRFSEQIMPKDKYRSISWRQMETIVYVFSRRIVNYALRAALKIGEYLALTNRPGGLYGRILTSVVSTDWTQGGLYTRPRSRFSHTDRLSSVNKDVYYMTKNRTIIKLIFQEIKSYQEVSKMSINTDISGV